MAIPVGPPELVELRLPAFKSVRDAVVPVNPLTLIVGRNGSGKSNILDGLAVLQAVASGADLRDALDGGRDGPVVRGGSEGCAPLGDQGFQIGCTATHEGVDYYLDLEVRTSPTVQILSEHLWSRQRTGPRRGEQLSFLKSEHPQFDSGDIWAAWNNGKRGPNPSIAFRASQLLTSQVATRVPATSAAGRRVHDVAEVVLEAISGIFILDPVPHQMREYIAEKDNRLRRTADNLSAVLARLMAEPFLRETLLEMTRSLSEAQVSDLSTVSSELGDVMVTLHERIGGRDRQVPARLMSDGTLRFLAVAAAILDTPGEILDAKRDLPPVFLADGSRVLVVEELENGLHPSQAALLLTRLKAAAADRQVSTIATTHSTAILDALSGADHASVMVCSRDAEGWSKVTRLTDFPDYFEVAGRSSLGAAATSDRLRPGERDRADVRDSLAYILGG